MSGEALLGGGYAFALIAGAFILEWLSAHTHRRSLRYRTAGFDYDHENDNWVCPEGEALWPHEFDREKRLVRYRAKPAVCNACHRKDACTDSDRGREITRPLDPWPHSEAGRFHRSISLMLVALAMLIVLVAAVRNHSPADLAALGAIGASGVAAAAWLMGDLRRHPDNFPEPAPAHGLAFGGADGDGSRPHSRWASQRASEAPEAPRPR